MKLYRKRFAKDFVDRRAVQRTETRDAILWDIDEDTFTCRVKIQGATNFVVAHYPRNWKKAPYWLKPGCAVRILHRSGVRGYVEVTGEGRAIPTPIEGDTAGKFPTYGGVTDQILTGLEMTETTPQSMGVYISSGTYRINNTTYLSDTDFFDSPSIIMDDPAPMIMGNTYDTDGNPDTDGIFLVLGTGGVILAVDAGPANGYMRYDAFVIDVSGEITYIKGTAAFNDPVKPTIPAGSILIGNYILVRSGVDVITNEDIGAEFETRIPTQMVITSDYGKGSQGMPYDPLYGSPGHAIPHNDISLEVRDQYNHSIKNGNNGWSIEVTLINGNGVLSPSGAILANPVETFEYSRIQQLSSGDDPEEGPVSITFVSNEDSFPFIATLDFDILDDNGDPIEGSWDAY